MIENSLFRNKQFRRVIGLLLGLVCFTACLEDRKIAPALALDLPSSYFSGVTSVKNMGGFPASIQINWTPTDQAVSYRIYIATINSGQTKGWTLVDEVFSPTQSSYIHRDASLLTPGSMYTYMVKAVTASGQEDPNENQRSTIAFEGVNRVTILSQTSVQISVNTAGSFSKLRIVAHPSRMAATDTSQDTTLTVGSNQSSLVLNGLKPGTTYAFSAQVLVGDDGTSDGNAVSLSAQTPSDSFGSGATDEGPASYQYRNMRLVQAYGAAPNELNSTTSPAAPAELTSLINPHFAVVKLVPNPFAGTQTGKFRIIRAAGIGLTGNDAPATLDTTTTTVCRQTTAGACVVCDHNTSQNVATGDCDLAINNIPPTFVDKSVAAPPKKYFYTVTAVNAYGTTLWPDELPTTNMKDFLVAAHIPDSYMVLVQRDSVNYEMCALLGQAPDPRHANRCVYTGIAATPYNTKGVALPLDAGYYDFGYNLLVDRHALSCSWSQKKPATATAAQPCAQANGCFGFGVGATNAGFPSESTADTAPNTLPMLTITPNSTYASSPLTYFNLQARGNNCYVAYLASATLKGGGDPAASAGSLTASWLPVGALADIGIGLSSATAPVTKSQITSIIAKSVTADPGTLGTGNYSDRKRPTISGLSNTQAQSLCNAQVSTAYGTKRLMRRREYVAASPLASLPGEPGFTTNDNRSALLNGTPGQTLYNWQSIPSSLYGNGKISGLGTNPGACSGTISPATITSNPLYCLTTTCSLPQNTVVPRTSSNYCALGGGCTLTTNSTAGFSTSITDADGATITYPDDFLSAYLDPRNELTGLVGQGTGTSANSYSNRFFIGSLGTNKCVSRFGMQDPYPTPGITNGGGITTGYNTAMGIFFSDKFKQTSTLVKTSNPPVYAPISNNLDFGVYYDYTYNNGTSTIEFSNANTGYSATGYNGNAHQVCTDATTSVAGDFYSNNFFYLSNILTAVTDTTTCASNGSGQLASLIKQPQRNQSTFSGYLPILGLPLTSYATALNVSQSQVDFASFLYANQFAPSPTQRQSYGRFYSASVTGTTTVNMSSGVGGRWSYELSEVNTTNNGGSAWCAVEAE